MVQQLRVYIALPEEVCSALGNQVLLDLTGTYMLMNISTYRHMPKYNYL